MIKISAVSYLNTFPFIYGMENSGLLHGFEIEKDVPALCAEKLIANKADIGLVPVAVIPLIKTPCIITDFCIGATGKVKTVLLLSNQSLDKITKIYLDFESRTSVQLVKVLSKHYWKINPQWEKLSNDFDHNFKEGEAVVLIGDKTFTATEKYSYIYDLASEWIQFTSLPFVFAAWVANKEIPDTFVTDLNAALKFGINHINETVSAYKKSIPSTIDAKDYFINNISYQLDEAKRKGMALFFDYLKGI
ncbi:MAG: menaquinone biosynthesis protein [Bacteroidetes bacterium]|nr:menaquinone biosynthesis protein [Bacteroidota bacterium]